MRETLSSFVAAFSEPLTANGQLENASEALREEGRDGPTDHPAHFLVD
jgi:hypothetical protein